jgi:hypothetical protein
MVSARDGDGPVGGIEAVWTAGDGSGVTASGVGGMTVTVALASDCSAGTRAGLFAVQEVEKTVKSTIINRQQPE